MGVSRAPSLDLLILCALFCVPLGFAAGVVVPLGHGDGTLSSRAEFVEEVVHASNASNASNASVVAPEPDMAGNDKYNENMESKVMLALSAAQGHTMIRNALLKAKDAVMVAKAAAAHAMSVANTPAEKQAALAQVGIAKGIMTAFQEQEAKYSPFKVTGKDSITFGQMEEEVRDKTMAQQQKASAENYKKQLAVEKAKQKEKDEEIDQDRQQQQQAPPPNTKDSAVYTQDQVDNMLAKAKEEAQQHLNIEIKKLNTEWAAKKANAVNEEKNNAREVIRAAKENSEKKVQIAESKVDLETQRAAIEIEKIRLENVQHAAASAALTATLNAKAEAAQIEQEAHILTAQNHYQATIDAIPGIRENNATGEDTGNSHVSGNDTSATVAASEVTLMATQPSDINLNSASAQQSKAFINGDVAATSETLMKKYNDAKEQLAASTAHEKQAKTNAKSSITLTPASLLSIQTPNTGTNTGTNTADANAKATLLKVEKEAGGPPAAATATNLQSAAVKAKQDELTVAQEKMQRAITDENGSKVGAKRRTEAEEDVASMPKTGGVTVLDQDYFH